MSEKRFMDHKSPPHVITLMCITAVGGFSMSIFLPSLPKMAEFFSASGSVMQLTISAYLAASAILQLIIGALADRFGRRPVLLIGLTVFLAGTLVCIFSKHIEVLILGRIIQAAAVSGWVLSRVIIHDQYEPAQAASIIGYVVMGMAISPVIAPVIGGFLATLFDWQASFLLIFIIGSITLFLVSVNLGETRKTKFTSFGTQFRQYPELFRSRRFWAYSLTSTFNIGVYYAFIGGAPILMTNLFNLSAIDFGLYFSSIATGYIIGNYLSGKFSIRMGINKMVMGGSIITFLILLFGVMLQFMGFTHPFAVFAPLSLIGIGTGITAPSASVGIINARPEISGSASGLGGSLQIGGAAIISAISGILVAMSNSALTLLGGMLVCSMLCVASSLYANSIEERPNNSGGK